MKFLCAFVLILAMAGSSCQKFNLNKDDLDIKLDLKIIQTNVNVQFKDAKTDDLIGFEDGSSIETSIYGPDSLWVVNISGERKLKFFTAGGFMSVGLDPFNAKPTLADPVQFTIVAKIPGYLSTSLPVKLFSEGTHDYVVKMVKLDMPPNGVIVSSQANIGTSVNGRLNSAMHVSTDNSEVKVSLPSGTGITDADGKQLTGDLDITIVHFNPTKASALSAFPGGLGVEVRNEGGSREDGLFYSAGFVAIEITDANDNKAANFTGGKLSIETAIDPTVYNPQSRRAVKAGDRVPMWSYNDRSGKWTYEKEVEIKGSPLGLRSYAELPHLSYWNLDWFQLSCAFAELVFTTSDGTKAGETGWGYGLYFVATLTGSTEFRTQGYFSGFPELTGIKTDLNTEVLNSVPLNQQVTITFYQQEGITPLWNLPAPITYDLCASSPVEVPLTPNPDATGGGDGHTLTITLHVEIFCTDRGVTATIPDGILIRYRLKGTLEWGTVTVAGSQVTVAGLQQNKIYEVQALYNGAWEPNPVFECFVEPSTESVVIMNLRFEVACGG